MQKLGLVIALLVVSGMAVALDIGNEATVSAVSKAQAAIESARTAKPALAAVKRIGVCNLEGDSGNVTALLKARLTRTDFQVVLVNDAEWGPLLDEFKRQYDRQDIILKETAHKLRVQGVDAVMFGKVEKTGIEKVEDARRQGERAEVRLMLSLASLAEENPGTLLWSEQVTGTAEAFQALSLDQRLTRSFENNRLAVIIGGGGIAVLLILLLVRQVIGRLSRPR